MIPAFLLGIVAWTLLEYTLHRWVFHEGRLGRRFAADHLRHHAEFDWFAPFWRKTAAAVVVVVPLGALGAAVAGAAGATWAVGIVAGWLGYEAFHRHLHARPPIGPWGRWARRNHFAHHFATPRANHGVTVGWWDRVFGTSSPPVGPIRVPRVHAGKLPWLVEGEPGTWRIRDAYAADYRLSARDHA